MQTQINEIVESAIANLTKAAEVNTIVGKPILALDGTTILSFAVALFAIVSLITVGFNQISYAAGEAAPEVAFTSAQGDRHIFGSGGADLEFIAMGFTPFMKDSGEYVICTEFLKNYIDGNSYSFSENLTDAGLKYLITELDKKLSGIEILF